MALSKSAEIPFSLKDCLIYDYGALETRCVEIWPVIWRIIANDPDKNSLPYQESDQLVCKMVHNYNHIHQLHRLLNKYLEAVRHVGAENLSVGVLFPPVLRCELERCFFGTSEQQMSLILGILIKELADQLNLVEQGGSGILTKTLAQLIWTCMRNLRVKTTTRQEVLQTLCKQFLDMKNAVVVPLMQLAKKSSTEEMVYSAAVMVHAWASFPLVFHDKFAISMEDPLQAILTCLDFLVAGKPASIQPEVIYWRHKLILLQFTINGASYDKTALPLYDWSSLNSAPVNASWPQNPFDITATTLSVALWESICSNYLLLPRSVTSGEHDISFAEFLVRSLLTQPLSTSVPSSTSKETSQTLHAVSEAFLDTGVISGSPGLHAALVHVLERSLKDSLEKKTKVIVKLSKKRAKHHDSVERFTEILRILTILNKIGFFVQDGVVRFSLSLIWKAFEFVLDHPGDKDKFIQAEIAFTNLILSVPSKDPKYWTNVLWDFCAIRGKIHAVHLDRKITDLFNQQCFRMILLITDSGSIENLTLLFETAREKGIFLIPLILDALLLRLREPGMVKLAHDVVGDLCDRYIRMMGVTENDEESLVLCATMSRCIQKAAGELKKIGSKKFKSTIADLRKFLVSATVYAATETAVESRNLAELDLALSNLALFIEVRSSCKIRVVKQVLSLFHAPCRLEEREKDARDVPVGNTLDELDDAALYRLLVATPDQAIRMLPVIERSTSTFSFSSLTGILVVLFSQFGKYCKPGKFTGLLKHSLNAVLVDMMAGRAPPEWNILLYKLVISLKGMPAVSRVFASVDDHILDGLSSILRSAKEVNILCDLMSLLQILLHGQKSLDVCRVALSRPVYECLLRTDLSDTDFTSLFERCSALLNDIMQQPHLLCPQTAPVIINATSVWLISILQRARQTSPVSPTQKALMIRNSSFVERLFGTFWKHRTFSKLVIHLIAVYCQALQNGALYPEAKEHIVAGLYRLLDGIDPHSKSMGSVTMGVESREIYRKLVEDHQSFHKYRGLV